jgi:hypothetical protein
MLLATADPRVSRDFAAKWLEELSSEERLLLKMYFLHHLSLKETSTALYVHKKTLQYRLDKIAEKSGLEALPRCRQDIHCPFVSRWGCVNRGLFSTCNKSQDQALVHGTFLFMCKSAYNGISEY